VGKGVWPLFLFLSAIDAMLKNFYSRVPNARYMMFKQN
jgi:hypothetical protein